MRAVQIECRKCTFRFDIFESASEIAALFVARGNSLNKVIYTSPFKENRLRASGFQMMEKTVSPMSQRLPTCIVLVPLKQHHSER